LKARIDVNSTPEHKAKTDAMHRLLLVYVGESNREAWKTLVPVIYENIGMY